MTSSSIAAGGAFDFRDAWVVMVDQSNGFMDIMSQMLSGFGFKKFRRFTDLERYRERRDHVSPDLILIDPHPDREGALDFIQEVRQQDASGQGSMLVIVVTSQPNTSVVQEARARGADYVVVKPFSAKVLLDRILWSANAEPSWEPNELPQEGRHPEAVPLQ